MTTDPTSTTDRRPADPECLRVGCSRRATWVLTPTYGRATKWCGLHVAEFEATGRDLERRRLPRSRS